jgi:hypothetical protein
MMWYFFGGFTGTLGLLMVLDSAYCGGFKVSALLAALASIPVAEAVKMLASGATLAVAVSRRRKREGGGGSIFNA